MLNISAGNFRWFYSSMMGLEETSKGNQLLGAWTNLETIEIICQISGIIKHE